MYTHSIIEDRDLFTIRWDNTRKLRREIKTKQLLGEFNKPNKKNIKPKIYNIAKELSIYGSVGGSFVLKIYNLINRDVNDIDLVVNMEEFKILENKFSLNKSWYKYETNNYIYKFTYKGISIDVHINDNVTLLNVYNGIRLVSMSEIIYKKVLYDRNKDRKDIIDINFAIENNAQYKIHSLCLRDRIYLFFNKKNYWV